MGNVISVVSGKGGVGKTFLTANIGANISLLGKSVLLIDADFGQRCLDIPLGTDNSIVYNFLDVLEKKCTLSQAVIRDKRYGELYILAGVQSKDSACIGLDILKAFIDDIKDLYDYILIDLPSGSSSGVTNCLLVSDKAILVTTPDKASLRAADKIKNIIGNMRNIHETNIIINRMIPQLTKSKDSLSSTDISDILGLNIYGVISESIDIIKSMNSGVPLTNNRSDAAKEIMHIASSICGETFKHYSSKQLYKTIRKKHKINAN